MGDSTANKSATLPQPCHIDAVLSLWKSTLELDSLSKTYRVALYRMYMLCIRQQEEGIPVGTWIVSFCVIFLMTRLFIPAFSSTIPNSMLPYNTKEISDPRGWVWGVLPAHGPANIWQRWVLMSIVAVGDCLYDIYSSECSRAYWSFELLLFRDLSQLDNVWYDLLAKWQFFLLCYSIRMVITKSDHCLSVAITWQGAQKWIGIRCTSRANWKVFKVLGTRQAAIAAIVAVIVIT